MVDHIHIVSVPFPDDNNNVSYVWDNHTDGQSVVEWDRKKEPFFLIGMSLVAGLVSGVLLHGLIVFVIRFFGLQRTDEATTDDGSINLSFIGDHTSPVDNDDPPDYASVMSGDNCDGAQPKNDRGLMNSLMRILRRSSDQSERRLIEEEAPPSYSRAVEILERDLSNR